MSAQYNPNKLGWGAAAVTCLMTAGLAFTAYTIHKNTYLHPRDPMAKQVYQAIDHAAASDHEAAPAGAAQHTADSTTPAAEAKPKH